MTPPVNQIYIRPTLHIHPNLDAAKEFSDTFGAYHFWSDKKSSAFQMPLWANATLQSVNLV
jgi:hypothetical protein